MRSEPLVWMICEMDTKLCLAGFTDTPDTGLDMVASFTAENEPFTWYLVAVLNEASCLQDQIAIVQDLISKLPSESPTEMSRGSWLPNTNAYGRHARYGARRKKHGWK